MLCFALLCFGEQVDNKIGERVANAVAGLILDSDDEEEPPEEDVRGSEVTEVPSISIDVNDVQ